MSAPDPGPATARGRRAFLRDAALAAGGAFAAGGAAPTAVAAPASTGARVGARLMLNENPWGPSPAARRAVEAALEDLWRYTGDEADALAARLARRERVAPEQIVVGDVLRPLGAQLALAKGPGAEVLLSTPGFTLLADAAAQVGGRQVGVPLTGALTDDLDGLAARLGPRTAATFLVAPHNPSGTLAEREAYDRFARAASAHGTLIVDEAYLDYTDEFEARTAARWVREGLDVVVYRTFTKFWGLAALPLDYLVTTPALAQRLRAAGLGAARDQNRLAVVAATASLDDRAYEVRVRTGVARERHRWLALLRERGAPHSASVANFVFFDAGRPHAEAAAAFRAAGIEVARRFEPYDTWVRVTIGRPADNDRALDVADRLLARRGAATPT